MSAERVPPPARRWKWWQIALAVVFGVGVIGNLVDPDRGKTPLAASAKVAVREPEFRRWQGRDTFVMIVDPSSDPAGWRGAAKAYCGAREFCKVLAWTNEVDAPAGFPMTDHEAETQAFSYGVNRVSGYEEATWDCKRFAAMPNCAAR